MKEFGIRKSVMGMLALWAALVVLSDWLFFRERLGISVAIYVFSLSSAIWLLRPAVLTRKHGLFLSGTLVASCFALAWEPSSLMAALSVLQLCSLLFVARIGWTSDTRRWLRRWIYFATREWERPISDIFVFKRSSKRFLQEFYRFFNRIQVWLLPVSLGLVFVALFILANPLIDAWVSVGLRKLEWLIFRLFQIVEPARIVFWSVLGYVIWIFIRGRVGELKKSESNTFGNVVTPLELTRRCLCVFNLVFLAQTVMDLVFLWGGFTLPSGLTYAEYAHRGAYPLLATALLSAVFILISFPAGSDAESDPMAKNLVYLWIAQNIFLCFNSIWRLALYVNVYSLTLFRVAAAIWMGLVVVGFILIAIRIALRRANGWLLNHNAAALITVLFVCGFLNLKGWVAWYNVSHCLEVRGRGAALDAQYLHELGTAALPAIQWYLDKSSDFNSRTHLRAIKKKLDVELYLDIEDWRSWTIQRHILSKRIPAHWQSRRGKK